MTQQLAFASWGKGELSPQVRGKIDLLHYYSSAESLLGMIVRPYSNLVRCAGTYFCGEVKDSTKDVRLIEFIFSVLESYAIEFGPEYFRIWNNDGTPLTIAIADVDAWSGGSYAYTQGDYVKDADKVYYCKTDHLSTNDNKPGSGTFWHLLVETKTDSGDWIVEIPHVYTEEQLWLVDYAQKNDTITFCDGVNDVSELRRYGATDWRFIEGGLIVGPPWEELNDDKENRMKCSSKIVEDVIDPNGITVTYTAEKDTFTSADEGRYFRLHNFNEDGEQGYFKCVAYQNAKEVKGHNLVEISKADSKTTRWSRNAFYEDNYPSVVTYHESRMVLGRTPSDPDRYHLSRTFLYRDFNTADNDEGGFSIGLNTADASDIKWIASCGNLAVGTFGAEFTSRSPSEGSLTTDSKNAKFESKYGSEKVRPCKVGNNLYFVQRGARKLREFFFQWDANRYNADDMTEFADHITLGGIVDMAHQLNPDDLLWCVLGNGRLIILTRNAKQEVQAWTPRETDGEFKSLRFIPNPDGLSDRGFAIVSREINESTVKYIEYFDNHVVEDDTDLTQKPYLDCMIAPEITDGTDASVAATVGNDLSISVNPDPDNYYAGTLGNDLEVTATTNTDLYIASTVGNDLVITSGSDTTQKILDKTIGSFSTSDIGKTVVIINSSGTLLASLLITNLTYAGSKAVCTSSYSTGTIAGGLWGFSTEAVISPAPWTITLTENYFNSGTTDTGKIIKIIDSAGTRLARFTLERYISAKVFEAYNHDDGDPAVYSAAGGKWTRSTNTSSPFSYESLLVKDKYLLSCGSDYFDGLDVDDSVFVINPLSGDVFFPFIVTTTIDKENVYAVFTGADNVEYWLQLKIAIESGTYVIDGGEWGVNDDEITPAAEFETNLLPLEGETVSVFGDGDYYGDVTVTNGVISQSIISLFTDVVVGLPFTSIVKQNPLNAQTPRGIAKGNIMRINKIGVQVYRTREIEVGSNVNRMFPLNNPEGAPEGEFTGIIPNVTFDGDNDYEGYIILRQTKPYPMNILGIYPEVDVRG